LCVQKTKSSKKKKYIRFVIKKEVDERGEKELIATPPSTYITTFHIQTTQLDKKGYHQRYVIHIRDGYPHSHYKKTLPLYKKQRIKTPSLTHYTHKTYNNQLR